MKWCALTHTPKIGTEYEVANGEVVHNLESEGPSRASRRRPRSICFAFHVVEDFHKLLWEESAIVRQGYKVVYAEQDALIALKGG